MSNVARGGTAFVPGLADAVASATLNVPDAGP